MKRSDLVPMLDACNEVYGLCQRALPESKGTAAADINAAMKVLEVFAARVQGPVAVSGDAPLLIPGPSEAVRRSIEVLNAPLTEGGMATGGRSALRRAAEFIRRALRRNAGPGRELPAGASLMTRGAAVALATALVVAAPFVGLRLGAKALGVPPAAALLIVGGLLYLATRKG